MENIIDILNLSTQPFNFFPLAFVEPILGLPVSNLIFFCGFTVTCLGIVGKIPPWINLNHFQRTVLTFFGITILTFASVLIVYNTFLSKDSIKDGPPPIVSPENLKENLKKDARKILRKQGKNGIDQAKEKFLEAKKIDPEDPEISYYLGWLDDLNYSLFKKGECQSASERYEETMELFKNKQPQNNIGKEMVIEIGHFLSNRDTEHGRAIKLYNKYILDKSNELSDPVNYMALVSRGMAFFWLKEYGKSGEDFEDALAEESSNQVAYNRGSIYAMNRNYNKAINYYEAAIYGGKVKLIFHGDKEVTIPGDFNFDEARRDIGFALLLKEDSNEQQYEKALYQFQEAIKVRKGNKESPNYSTYIGKGIAQYFLGDVNQAKNTLKEVPETSPYSNTAKRYLNRINTCESSNQKQCVNHVREIQEDIADTSVFPILTSKGISTMFGNVTVHESDKLDEVIYLEHNALYKGPCK
jgi:tetratricopeptide (TPR) repeat protein